MAFIQTNTYICKIGMDSIRVYFCHLWCQYSLLLIWSYTDMRKLFYSIPDSNTTWTDIEPIMIRWTNTIPHRIHKLMAVYSGFCICFYASIFDMCIHCWPGSTGWHLWFYLWIHNSLREILIYSYFTILDSSTVDVYLVLEFDFVIWKIKDSVIFFLKICTTNDHDRH